MERSYEIPHVARPRRAHGVTPATGHPDRSERTALVVGAGVGGLAAAARLAHRGFDVTVLEQHDVPGGRVGLWRSAGFTFDTGASLVMMTEYWHRLFRHLNRRLEDYVTLVPLDPCYRIHFPDGTTHDRTSAIDRLIEGCETIEPGCGPRLLAYLATTGKLYADGLRFIDRNLHRLSDMLSLPHLRLLGGAGATVLCRHPPLLPGLARRHPAARLHRHPAETARLRRPARGLRHPGPGDAPHSRPRQSVRHRIAGPHLLSRHRR